MIWYALGIMVLAAIFGSYIFGLLTWPSEGFYRLLLYLGAKYEGQRGLKLAMHTLSFVNLSWIGAVVLFWAFWCARQFHYFADDPSVQYRWVYQSIGFLTCLAPVTLVLTSDRPRDTRLAFTYVRITLILTYILFTVWRP